jgi:hypothetical protein
MVLLANVALTDTFDIWRQRTNQVIIELNRLETEDDGNITSAFLKANQVGAAVTTANTNVANLGGALITANSNITSAFLKANQVGAAVTTANTNITNLGGALTTANSNITAAFLKANQVGAAVTTANTNITNLGGALITSNSNITSAFLKANNALANTTGAVFNGNLIISSTLTVSSNLTISSGTIDTARANILSQILSDGATITWNASLGQIAYITLGGNRTVAAPTNLRVGTYILHVIQDGSGNRTLTWNSVFKWTAAVAPVLSTAANRRDIISFVSDGTNLYGTYMPDVR